MKKIGILGSTGSIGTQALQVTDMQVGNYAIKYLTAYNDIDELSKQAIKYNPEIVCIVDKSKHKELENLLSKTEILVVSGRSALLEIASRDDVDLCINGLVGAAGMAAHLAGAIKAHSTLPVIGVPLSGGIMTGLDSLLSTVQMPKGVPVATLAVGKAGAINAAILSAEILSLNNDELVKKLNDFKSLGCKL